MITSSCTVCMCKKKPSFIIKHYCLKAICFQYAQCHWLWASIAPEVLTFTHRPSPFPKKCPPVHNTVCWVYDCSEQSSMWLPTVDSTYQLLSHTGSDMEKFMRQDATVGVASWLQVGCLREQVSILGKSNRILSSWSHQHRNWYPFGNQFELCQGLTCSSPLFSFSVGAENVWSFTSFLSPQFSHTIVHFTAFSWW